MRDVVTAAANTSKQIKLIQRANREHSTVAENLLDAGWPTSGAISERNAARGRAKRGQRRARNQTCLGAASTAPDACAARAASARVQRARGRAACNGALIHPLHDSLGRHRHPHDRPRRSSCSRWDDWLAAATVDHARITPRGRPLARAGPHV